MDRRRRRRLLVLTISLSLHLAALAGMLLAQAWQVGKLPPPEMNIVPLHFLQTPQEEGHGGKQRDPTPARRQPPQRRPQVPSTSQPPEVPQLAPPTPSDAPVSPLPDADPSPAADLLDNPSDTGKGEGKGPGTGTGWGDGNGAATGPVKDPPIEVTGEVVRPEILVRVDPRYTEPGRKARVQGMVVVRATIDERGNVVDVSLLKGLPMGLDREAVEAVRHWKFKPAMLYGQPVKVFFTLRVSFKVQ
ncbi:MAG: TonB family protein [Acidobacteriota bacterium]|nr:TonB family protein [Acidobacteriota bacterium]